VSRLLKFFLLVALLIASPGYAQSIEYIHTDALGSPVAITDANGNVIERSEYEPYGAMLNRPADDRPGYTGHVVDAATGLNYMQQRYYDPGIGRFLSVDPVTANPNTGANFNRYAYVPNSPYKFKDPDGRYECQASKDQCKMVARAV
jgi:RHS repeat-associated protein